MKRHVCMLIMSVVVVCVMFIAPGYAAPLDDLMRAISENSVPGVEAAIKNGADMNGELKTADGQVFAPLMFAVGEKKTDIVKLLIEKGANVNLKISDGPYKGTTPIIVAAFAQNNEMVKFLIEKGADVNVTVTEGNLKGFSALVQAEITNDAVMIDLLAKAGATLDDAQKTQIKQMRVSRTKADMRAIGTAVGSYQVDKNVYPKAETATDFSSLKEIFDGKYYEGRTTDWWGTPLKYVSDGKTYTLTSYGEDKAAGNDDIVYKDGAFVE